MSELKFTRVNNEEYNTVSINIENAFIEIKIKSVWINENNKPFIQLYYVRHT